MLKLCVLSSVLALFIACCVCDEFEKLYQWKQLAHKRSQTPGSGSLILFETEDPQRVSNESFVSYNNIPIGVTHHKGRLFITTPRRRPGVPTSLSVIDIANVPKGEKSPLLEAYRDYITNELHRDYHGDLKRIVSVYRTKVDICERLWFVDIGMLEYPDNPMQIQRPQVWVIDLKRNRKIRAFPIPEAIVLQGVGMASLVVDVEPGQCDKAFAYIPDLMENSLYVYSFEQNRIWAFKHSTFRHDPTRASFHVAGQRFDWDDGIFSITLGKLDPITGAKPVYYHPMVSTEEFVTSTAVLRNETLANTGGYETMFRSLGHRGPNTQSTMHHYDPQTDVVFYGEVNRNSIGCWNTKQNFSAENHDVVHVDHKELIYPTDLNADLDGTIWVLANNLPTWIYSRLDENEYNYHVWHQKPQKAIARTKCAD